MRNHNRNSLLIIGGIALLALLAFNIYLMSDRNKKEVVIENQTSDLQLKDSVLTELNTEYDDAIDKLNSQLSQNSGLNDKIEEQKKALTRNKNRIARLVKEGKASKNELTFARDQISELTIQRDQFLTEIDALKRENQVLVAENKTVKTQKVELEQQVITERTKTTDLTEENVQLVSDKKVLEEKVSQAKVLQISNIAAKGVKERNSGKLRDVKYARRVDYINVCFTAEPNLVADQGADEFILRIINPLGETLSQEMRGSGLFRMENGSEAKYTLAKNLNYGGGEQEVCILWGSKDDKFEKGVYLLEIFNKGYKVGASELVLK